MPAKSKKQQMAARAPPCPPNAASGRFLSLKGASREMVGSMSEKELAESRAYEAKGIAAEEAARLKTKTPASAGVLFDQLSKKLLSFLLRLGCFNFRSAFASICLMRSRVTENCWPTSSSV